MTQKQLLNEKVRLLLSLLALPRLLGPWSKLPPAIFVACCLVFCLHTEVAMFLPFMPFPTPEKSCYVPADVLSFVLHGAMWLSAQDSSRGGDMPPTIFKYYVDAPGRAISVFALEILCWKCKVLPFV